MPYVTSFPSSVITVGVDGVVAFVPGTSVLNAFDDSVQFSQYDVDSSTGPTTLSKGDNIALVDSTGNTINSGTYEGGMTVLNAAAVINVPAVANVTLQVAPITGYVMMETGSVSAAAAAAAAAGDYLFISDQPIDNNHLSVTASVTILGRNITVTGPIAGITGQLAAAIASGVPILGPTLAATLNATGNLLQVTANTAIVTANHDANINLILPQELVVPCFSRGTLIETAYGFVAVENLSVGDQVLTRDHGNKTIRWIGSVRLDAATLADNENLRPIRIKAGALGSETPTHDLVVSPQHRVLIRSKVAIKMFGAEEVLIAAKHLQEVDGIDVAEDMQEVEYFHFLFDQHEVVNSNGAATEAMYTGAQALQAIGHAARNEIFELFPELKDPGYRWEPARIFPSGRHSRKLVSRHVQHQRHLYC